MKFFETASNGTCPTCGKAIDWGQEYCNNCRPPIDAVSNTEYKFYCNYCDIEWTSNDRDDIKHCPICGRYGADITPLP